MAWKIKQTPDDFVVREIIQDRLEESWKEKVKSLHGKRSGGDGGLYLWFTMKKTNVDFFEAVDRMARALKIRPESICHAGTKDKRAVTFQTISIRGASEDDVRKLHLAGIEFSDFRRRARPVKLGDHTGNFFEIAVRGIEENEIKPAEIRIKKIQRDGMVNFFGEQRFGVENQNHVIGMGMVKGDEKTIRNHENEPKTLRMLYVHAYQSWLWNETARKLPRSDIWVPVVGYQTRLDDYPESSAVIREILEKEGVAPKDFRIRAFRDMSCRGEDRRLVVRPSGLSYSFAKDEMHPGKFRLLLKFGLPKGSYATELVKQIAPENP